MNNVSRHQNHPGQLRSPTDVTETSPSQGMGHILPKTPQYQKLEDGAGFPTNGLRRQAPKLDHKPHLPPMLSRFEKIFAAAINPKNPPDRETVMATLQNPPVMKQELSMLVKFLQKKLPANLQPTRQGHDALKYVQNATVDVVADLLSHAPFYFENRQPKTTSSQRRQPPLKQTTLRSTLP